jgi:hypothetical protein
VTLIFVSVAVGPPPYSFQRARPAHRTLTASPEVEKLEGPAGGGPAMLFQPAGPVDYGEKMPKVSTS